MAFGFPTEPYTTRGSDPQEMVVVHLPDGAVILTRDGYDDAVESSQNATAFEKAVRRLKIAKKAEWEARRGPDSDLGRTLEQGTPTTDHGGETP